MFKKMVRERGLEKNFLIESAATSSEELGNDMHSGAKQKLLQMDVPFEKRRARRISQEDYSGFDLLIGMDMENLYYMQREWNKDPDDKIKLLMTYAGKDKDIADPWYTGNFDETYRDLENGLNALLDSLAGGRKRD